MESYPLKDQNENEVNDSPMEQVRLAIPITDDPTLPALTFRTWVLGPLSCALLAVVTEFFLYRQSPLSISGTCFQVLLVPLGHLMAATLPTKPVRLLGTKWAFSMNPGPFNIKEHVLITIFSNSGLSPPLGIQLVNQVKLFYKKKISIWAALSMTVTTQMLGYGFAGIFMKFLVDSPYMWWPYSLMDVSFFRTLHEVEARDKGKLTRLQYLVVVAVLSFSYYIVPNYFFPSITTLSSICLIWKNSVVAQQIGSGAHGLGLGSFSMDWATITSYLPNPLAIPSFTLVNTMVGFILFLYAIVPIAYWSNSYNARRFPFYSYDLYDFGGQRYNISRVLNDKEITFNLPGYKSYSDIYMSIASLCAYGFQFASLSATLTHFAIFHGRDTWLQFLVAYKEKNNYHDIHNRLMKKYKAIPQWWFFVILVSTITLAIITCEGYKKELQLPYWGVLLGCLLINIFLLPASVIEATTGQGIQLNVISELIMGYIYPGKPLATISFKTYGLTALDQAKSFIYDFKLAHYIKIPPRCMFIAQIAGTLFSTLLHLGSAWWLLSTVDNICDVENLPKGSPWTCPSVHAYYNNNIIWGVIGPSRVFAPNGVYSNIYYFFLIGVVATLLIWLVSKLFPEKKWIRLINVPIIFGSATVLPIAGAVHYWSWFTIGFVFSFFIFRKYKGWWTRYNYILACGLDLGVAFSALLISLTLQLPKDVYGVNWWGFELTDHCSLSRCPTASGVSVEGCPVL